MLKKIWPWVAVSFGRPEYHSKFIWLLQHRRILIIVSLHASWLPDVSVNYMFCNIGSWGHWPLILQLWCLSTLKTFGIRSTLLGSNVELRANSGHLFGHSGCNSTQWFSRVDAVTWKPSYLMQGPLSRSSNYQADLSLLWPDQATLCTL